MPAKTDDLRPELRKTYLYVVNNFAVTTRDVADALFDGDIKVAGAGLRLLGGLVNGEKVNGEGPLVWQSYYDIENTDPKETLKSARADFNRAFPEPVGPSVERKNGTGPRYTDEQIKKGLAAKKAGKTNREVAEIAGVKSPAYFSKTLKALIAAETPKPEPRSRRQVAAKSAAIDKKLQSLGVEVKPRRVVRSSKKAGK